MVMDPERDMDFSVDQSRKKLRGEGLKFGAIDVAPCVLEEAGTDQCRNRLMGTITCPVALGKSDPLNRGCEEAIGKYCTKNQ